MELRQSSGSPGIDNLSVALQRVVQLIAQIERSGRRDQRASDENEGRQLRNIAEEVNGEVVAMACYRRAARPHSEQHGGIEDKVLARVVGLAHTSIVGCA